MATYVNFEGVARVNKRRLYQLCKKYVNASNINIVILCILILIMFFKGFGQEEYDFSSFFDVSIIFSFFLLFVCEVLANIISSWIMKKCEDAVKLTEDYEKLNRKYCRESLISYNKVQFPEICLAKRKVGDKPFDMEFEFDVEHPVYQLPGQVADHSEELMEAHSYSTIYNNMNVRLNDCIQQGNKIKLLYSSTTYFDSLVTNRAMDHPIKGKSIREIYEPGPFLSSLSESKMSNHLGFNGFIELAEGKIIFTHRNINVSIGKGTLSTSISASYKTVYGLDNQRHMTRKTLANAIRMEIKDELKIDVSKFKNLDESVFAFYRDIVEGGKPQFLFYVKIPDLTVELFEKNFYSQMKDKVQKQQDHSKVIIDGNCFEYFTIDDLRSFSYQPGGITIHDGTFYRMMPSATASIIMFLEAIG